MTGCIEHILQVEGLGVSYGGAQAVAGISLDVAPGEIVGLVGESGSGKSTVLRAIAGLLGRSGAVNGGRILYRGMDVTALPAKKISSLRGREIAYVFQDPVAALDPLCRIKGQFDECLAAQGSTRGADSLKREHALLAEMGFEDPSRILASYPHNLSGGMCQRVVLAMAVACEPSLLLADEPTSALDVTSQLQVSKLLLRIREEHGCAMIVVSHNIAALAQVADRIGVMKAGKLVEVGARDQVLHHPAHPYTQELIAAVPSMGRAASLASEGEEGEGDVA